MKVTPKELIEETANFYNLSNRGNNIHSLQCDYLASNGNKCAVGRCILDEKVEEFQDRFEGEGIYSIVECYGEEFKCYLNPKYLDISQDLWDALQTFHDCSNNWTETGLSVEGLDNKEELLKRFA